MAIEAFYGDTMSGKSQAIERLARHIFEMNGKKTRVYIGDGGEETYNSHGLVDDGVIEVFDFSSREWPMTIVKLMGDLYFPKDPKDPHSKLIPPPANLSEAYGLIVFEGGTVMGQYMGSDIKGGMAWHAAEGTGFGGVKDESDELSTEDGIEGYSEYKSQGALSGKHAFLIQRKILNAIRSSKKFPGMVIWTAHPTEAPDKTEGAKSDQFGKITGKVIIGPDFGGKAPASLIGKEFGNLLHFDLVNLSETEKDPTNQKQITSVKRQHRVYTRRHRDPNMVVQTEYLAGNRCAIPEMMPDFFISKEPGDGVMQFYQTMSDARKQAKEKK